MISLPRRLLLSAIRSLGLICLLSAPAGAEVLLSGNEDKVVLQLSDATVDDVVSGIRSALNVQIDVSGATPRRFTGTYVGPLRRVLSRLLDGEDFVISSATGRMNIVIFAKRGVAQPVQRVASSEQANALQGWAGTAPVARTPPARPAAPAQAEVVAIRGTAHGATDDEVVNPVQGWDGTAIVATSVPSAVAAAESHGIDANSAADDVEAINPLQGWNATINPFKIARADGPAAAAQPAADDGEAINPVQGRVGAVSWISADHAPTAAQATEAATAPRANLPRE